MAKPPGLSLFVRMVSRPEGFLAGTFAGLILCGALLLSLPISHARSPVSPLDALFTSTSAVCVTGLTTVDTQFDFSRFGQMVILVLIQCGGLGIMTFAALIIQIAGHRISFRSQAALHDVFFQKNAAARFSRNLLWIFILTFAIEAVGAAVLFGARPHGMGTSEAAFSAVFHSVSAFCNAGFSTFSRNMVEVKHSLVFCGTVATLIVLGGLGYSVLIEISEWGWRWFRRRHNPVVWSLNTRVVLTTTIILIFGGAAVLHVLGLSPSETAWESRAGHALFQSISSRTAGFNTVDLGRSPLASLLWLTFLMFVGGSPGSCAGGIKTTSLAVWVARLKARLSHHEDVAIAGRRIPVDVVRRVGLLLGTATLFNLIGVLLLSITEARYEGIRLEQLLFEQISAFGTVGLSTGITPQLTAIGKLWIILTMYIGRLGPLTIALVVMERKPSPVRLAEEHLMIG